MPVLADEMNLSTFCDAVGTNSLASRFKLASSRSSTRDTKSSSPKVSDAMLAKRRLPTKLLLKLCCRSSSKLREAWKAWMLCSSAWLKLWRTTCLALMWPPVTPSETLFLLTLTMSWMARTSKSCSRRMTIWCVPILQYKLNASL